MATNSDGPHLEDVVRAAELIRRHDFALPSMELFRQFVNCEYDWLDLLVRCLVHEGGKSGLGYQDSVAQAEVDLEQLYESDEVVACVFMARLLPMIGYGMHQERDAILIHLYECKHASLTSYLEREAEREHDLCVGEELVEMVRTRKTKADSGSVPR